MKKLCSVLLALTLLLSLAACTPAPSTTPDPAPGTTTPDNTTPETPVTPAGPAAPEEPKTYVVGVCQLAQHPALDAATQGFKDVLTEKLGDAVRFDEGNAAGDSAACTTICAGFAADGVDLILANATASLQAAASATSTIPVLGTAITEYGVALGLSDFSGTVGTNVSGTSDLAPLDQQAAMVKEIFPDAQNVGILYCSGEPNSVYQAEVVKAELEKLGCTVSVYTFADSNDVASVTANACDGSDVLYIPTDNTAASCAEAINNVAQPAGVPIIAGEEGICTGCGVATLSIDYYELGRTTGEMAVRILTGESNVAEMPIEYYADPAKKYNADISTALNVAIPEGYAAIGE